MIADRATYTEANTFVAMMTVHKAWEAWHLPDHERGHLLVHLVPYPGHEVVIYG